MSAQEAEGAEEPWLDAGQLAAWRAFMNLAAQLPAVLNTQLERDAQLSFTEYYVLALLSEEDGRRMRMSSLASRANIELSRLSHLVRRLEKRGSLVREPDPDDGRYNVAILTDAGHACLAAAAPGHVRQVRELFVDALDADDLAALRRCAAKVTARIEARSRRRTSQ